MPPIRTSTQRRLARVASPPTVEDISTSESDSLSIPSEFNKEEAGPSTSARKAGPSFKGKLDEFAYSPVKEPKEDPRNPEHLARRWSSRASSAAAKRLAEIQKTGAKAKEKGKEVDGVESLTEQNMAVTSSPQSPPVSRLAVSGSQGLSTEPAVSPITPTRTVTLKRQTTLSPVKVQSTLSPIRTRSSISRTTSTISASSRAYTRKRNSRGYAPPETYAHLKLLPDVLEENLISIFVGLNPGIKTAEAGHAYAHPSNLFWKLLHSSGLTPLRRLDPTEDQTLPSLYSLGNTNIVARPTRDQAELKKQEMDDAVHILDAKIAKYKPESVCIVGKSIWESIFRVFHGRNMRKGEFDYGWQTTRMGCGEPGYAGARVFVATSTSGLSASTLPAEKERIWKILGDWVQERRRARGDIGGTARAETLVEEMQSEVKNEAVDTVMENIENEILDERINDAMETTKEEVMAKEATQETATSAVKRELKTEGL